MMEKKRDDLLDFVFFRNDTLATHVARFHSGGKEATSPTSKLKMTSTKKRKRSLTSLNLKPPRSRHESGPKSHIIGHINQDGSIRPVANQAHSDLDLQDEVNISEVAAEESDLVVVVDEESRSSKGPEDKDESRETRDPDLSKTGMGHEDVIVIKQNDSSSMGLANELTVVNEQEQLETPAGEKEKL